MILAACPGGPTSNLIAHFAKGDTALSVSLTALSVSLTALSSFVTILTIPFIVNFALVHFLGESQVVRLNVLETIIQIFVIIVIPVGIGMLIRHFKEGFALRMAKPVRTASGIVIALVIIGIVIKEKENFVSYFQQAGLVALALNVTTMAVGYYSSRLFKITVDILHSVNEWIPITYTKLCAVIPHGFLQVPASDRYCGSIAQIAPFSSHRPSRLPDG